MLMKLPSRRKRPLQREEIGAAISEAVGGSSEVGAGGEAVQGRVDRDRIDFELSARIIWSTRVSSDHGTTLYMRGQEIPSTKVVYEHHVTMFISVSC